MNMHQRLFGGLVGAAFLAMAGTANAMPIELVSNGGFETGTFAGWTNTGTGSGFAFTINDGTQDPFGTAVPIAPISGSFDAFSSQSGPGLNTLSQMLALPGSFSSLILSWDDRIQNWAGVFSDPNQEFRVGFFTGGGALIGTLFSTNPGDALIQIGPNPRSFDVTGLLTPFAGGVIELRLAQQDNLFFFNATVDNVSLLAEVPEPGTLALFAFGLLGLSAMRRRTRVEIVGP